MKKSMQFEPSVISYVHNIKAALQLAKPLEISSSSYPPPQTSSEIFQLTRKVFLSLIPIYLAANICFGICLLLLLYSLFHLNTVNFISVEIE